jgi:hypothetical protein
MYTVPLLNVKMAVCKQLEQHRCLYLRKLYTPGPGITVLRKVIINNSVTNEALVVPTK